MKPMNYLLAAALIPVSLWAGTITGTVTSSTGGAEVAKALLVLRQGSASAAVYDSVRSDSSGAYAFRSLPAASYWITGSATGFVTTTNNSVAVTATDTVVSNLVLQANVGTITGVVRSNGNILPGAVIKLYRPTQQTQNILDSTLTDSNGIYAFNNVPAGSPNYNVSAFTSVYGSGAWNTNVAVTSGGTTNSNFLLSTTGIRAPLSASSHELTWIRVGKNLEIGLQASPSTRTISIYGSNGALQRQVSVSAGQTRVTLLPEFAPSNGFLFQIK